MGQVETTEENEDRALQEEIGVWRARNMNVKGTRAPICKKYHSNYEALLWRHSEAQWQ